MQGPKYCVEICRPLYKKKQEPTPCRGCRNEPPTLDPRNYLFDAVYDQVFEFRNGYGGLDYTALLTYLSMLKLSPLEVEEILDKTKVVERIIAEKSRETLSENKKVDPQNKSNQKWQLKK